MTTINAINNNIGAATATSLKFPDGDGILDQNGVPILTFTSAASSVNYINILDSSTLNPPSINAVGSDTNISLLINSKGSGGIGIKGVSDDSNASIGYVGEFISSVVLQPSVINLINNTNIDITSISLTAGDWDVWGNASCEITSGSYNGLSGWISTTSATLPNDSLLNVMAGFTMSDNNGFCVPQLRFNVMTTTIIYLSMRCSNLSGSATGGGGIYARRIR